MMLPSILGENLLDSLWEDFAFPDIEKKLYGRQSNNRMKTDVRETPNGYEVDIDLPGFKKDEIRMQLKNGYLTVNAAKEMNQEEKNEQGTYVRRERYSGSMSRSFYVGESIAEKDIHPKYENGILSFCLPKEDKKQIEEKESYISIEG